MARVGPLHLVEAVRAVALILEGQPVEVVGLNVRGAYVFESDCAVAVEVHLGRARDIEDMAALFGLGQPDVTTRGLYSCDGDWLPPSHARGAVHLSLYGPPPMPAGAGVKDNGHRAKELAR